MKRYVIGALLLLAVIALASCAPALSANSPQTKETPGDNSALPAATPAEPVNTPAPRPTTDDLPKQPEPKAVPGLAEVESITVQPIDSDPGRIKVIAKGSLRDGCTKIDQVNVEQKGDTFMIVITTRRPSDAMCTQALVPFEQEIELSVENLAAGTYRLIVNQQQSTLELPLDK